MAISGDLVDFPLSDILFYLANRRSSGVLTVQSKGLEVAFTLMQGTVIAAESNNLRSRIGEQLVAAGAITGEQLTRTLNYQKAHARGMPIGSALVELNYLTPDAVRAALQQQCAGYLFEILLDNYGTFHFEPGPTSLRGVRVELEVNHLVFQAIHRADEWLEHQLQTQPVRLTIRADLDRVRIADVDDIQTMNILMHGPLTSRILASWMKRSHESVVSSFRRLYQLKLIDIVTPADQTMLRAG